MKRSNLLKVLSSFGLLVAFSLTGCAPVTVSSIPPDAGVYYKKSNKRIGTTPVKVNLYANSKEVVVRKEGYFSKTVVLSPTDPDNLDVKLKRSGKVFLLSRPSGADLYVDGQEEPVGRTPHQIDYDKSYRNFEIRAFGYESKKINISDDPEGNLVVDLVREPSLMLSSSPKGMDVFDEDGRKLGITPMPVPAVEEYTVELRKVGYYSQDVTLGPGTESPFVVEMVREPIVIIHSEPENAIVMHRGVALGKTPYRHLVKKDMDLEIIFSRYYTQKITIDPDSPRQIKVKLDPKPYITVQSSPAGAELYRSGGVELIGKTPVEILVERDTALEIHKKGYTIKPFTLSSDSNLEITVPLDPTTAGLEKTVVIDSKPSGAKVYRPGGAELIGTTPLKQFVSYERTFELHHEGYQTKIVTVAPDSANNIVFALAKDESARSVAISDPLLNTPSSF